MINNIYLSWRPEIGKTRFILGKIERKENSFIFKYLSPDLEEAKKLGFNSFPEFPDTKKIYEEKVLEIFSNRLISKDRNDSLKNLNFWKVTEKNDLFDILGLTQGKLSTDFFEFLAEFPYKKGFSFITDVAGITHLNLEVNSVLEGDSLKFIPEPENKFDNDAIALFKKKTKIGYIKKIHNRFFKGLTNDKIQINVLRIEKNGTIKKIFVSVLAI